MITLGLDTTGGHCSAALVNGAEILAHKSEDIGRGHAERLAPMVQEVLAEAGLTANDVTKLVVCTGPGSFTGLRVALAFAKGFALPRKLPVVGISALDVMAAQIDPHEKNKVVSVMDVRRGEVCWAVFDKRDCIQTPLTQKVEVAKAAILKAGYDRLAGDGAHLIAEPSQITVVSGTALAWLGKDKSPDDYPAVPLYSRGPDAKLPGGIDP